MDGRCGVFVVGAAALGGVGRPCRNHRTDTVAVVTDVRPMPAGTCVGNTTFLTDGRMGVTYPAARWPEMGSWSC